MLRGFMSTATTGWCWRASLAPGYWLTSPAVYTHFTVRVKGIFWRPLPISLDRNTPVFYTLIMNSAERTESKSKAMTFAVNWDNGGKACGTFPYRFETEDEASVWAENWARERNLEDLGMSDC